MSSSKSMSSGSSNSISQISSSSSSVITSQNSNSASNISSSATSTAVSDNSAIIKNDDSGIPDPVLYQTILSELNKSPTSQFTQNEALSLEILTKGELFEKTADVKIKDLKGIGYLGNLNSLYLPGNEITDISPVLSLKKLTTLDLSTNQISDISAASGLVGLETLNLAYNNITDISALSNLTNLSELDLWYNSIKDITPLLSLTKLSTLSLESNLLDMSDQKTIDSVNTLKARIKYFAMGLQGLQHNNDVSSSVSLYISKQQTYDSFSNITYNKVLLNNKPIETNQLYSITEPGSYILQLWDSNNLFYQFTFKIATSS